MSYSIEHKPSPGFIEVTYVGLTTGDDLREATSKAISLAKQTAATKCLVDATEIKVAATAFDVYYLCAKQYDDERLDRRTRIAVILPISPEARQVAQFYETVCKNRGWSVQLFSERQRAINWLMATITTSRSDPADG